MGVLETPCAADGFQVLKTFACARIKGVWIGRSHGHARNSEVGHKIVQGKPSRAAIDGFPHASPDAADPHGPGHSGMNQNGANATADAPGAEPCPRGGLYASHLRLRQSP